jgi:hypothetical protein
MFSNMASFFECVSINDSITCTQATSMHTELSTHVSKSPFVCGGI